MTLDLDPVASDAANATAIPLSIATDLSQPTLDLGVGISAETPLVAKLGAPLLQTTPLDVTERRIIKLRKRANGDTSDSFIQRYIDFAFRSCSI